MSETLIRISRLHHATGLPVPHRMTIGASGFDIRAALDTEVEIPVGGRAVIPTGFCFEIPQGFEIQVRPRSGLALKHGITILNAPGTIDSDYRGEVKIILINFGEKNFIVSHGDRIAQLVIARIVHNALFEETIELNESTRGTGGFGHTGV